MDKGQNNNMQAALSNATPAERFWIETWYKGFMESLKERHEGESNYDEPKDN